MKVLVVGGGGREHALAWKLANDSRHPEVFCAPGNAGTAEVATNLDIGAEDIDGLRRWAKANRPELTVVGPEAPLCAGLTDMLAAEGLRVFGPSRAAAQIEGSKIFAKEVMIAGGVPTARSAPFDDAGQALDYVRRGPFPLVVKAEGLAAGKGVFICASVAEAETAVRETMLDQAFGEAGRRIVVEEFLEGEEASILALVDGQHVVMLPSSQDHKRVFDQDRGPNTGGMGAYSPAPVVTEALWPVIREQVFGRTLAELRRRGIVYKGVLYAGLMISDKGPRVLEFNCRFGDPETQVVIPRLDGDLIPALEACVDGTLSDALVRVTRASCACVVMASGGYPGPYAKGTAISGLADAAAVPQAVVFHAGTKRDGAGRVVTAGGRVLGVTALGDSLKAAVDHAYAAVAKIHFDKAQYRKDIAARAFGRG